MTDDMRPESVGTGWGDTEDRLFTAGLAGHTEETGLLMDAARRIVELRRALKVWHERHTAKEGHTDWCLADRAAKANTYGTHGTLDEASTTGPNARLTRYDGCVCGWSWLDCRECWRHQCEGVCHYDRDIGGRRVFVTQKTDNNG
ncbi:MAG: hypothetical protein GY925_02555 [Actinomycetia bacterium]|nr:hypothetical protein [Actinomycetes bacterium]